MSKQRFITEVWDYRLSSASPLIYKGLPVNSPKHDPKTRTHENWCVCVYAKDDRSAPLEFHNTSIKVEATDANEQAGYDACYKFLRSVRDKYSLKEIEKLKPIVKEIRRVDKIRQKATDAYNAVIQENS